MTALRRLWRKAAAALTPSALACLGAAASLAFAPGILAAVPVSAEFVAKAPDPRGGDAGFNTFQRLPDGRGITFGGFSHDRNGNNAVVAYDPVADAWQFLQPNIPWVDDYDVTGRTFLGNRDDHVTMIVDNRYWAIDGQRGVPLLGNYRGVFDVATGSWAIDDDAALFGPTGTFFGVWMLSAADWHAALDRGYIFGGLVNGNPTDGVLIIERNPPGVTPAFRYTEYRRRFDDYPAFEGAERLYYLNNQHWQRGAHVHIYGGQQQIRYAVPDTRVDSANLWQLELTHPPRLSVLSTNNLPDGQRIQGNKLYAYFDPAHDIVVVSNGKQVNVYEYATGLWHYVPVLTPADADRESPSPQGAGRAGFYSPEAGQYIVLGGHGNTYGLKLNFSGPTVPSPPTGVAATAGNASAVVTFSAPASDGGSPVTSYAVTSSPAGGVDTQAGTTATTRSITGLANGIAYTFTVTATNATGTSAPSIPSNPVTPSAPATAPGSPTNVAATAGNASAVVSFAAPSYDGGSPITHYTVAATPPGGTDQQAGTAATTRSITGLANGTSYTFTVTAHNAIGPGPASAPSNAVVPSAPATLPAAPAGVVAIAGDGQATIQIAPPPTDGGSPITSYVVTASPPGGIDMQAGTAASTRSMTGLVNGVSYTFTARAVNAVGPGPASGPSNAVTPAVAGAKRWAARDFDASNRADLLWRNTADGRHAIWLMRGTAPVSTGAVALAPTETVAHVADLDGDARVDLLVRDAVSGATGARIIDGTTVVAAAPLLADASWRIAHTGDFDGDGRADLVWRSDATGTTSLWLMNGAQFASGATLLDVAAWKVTQVADFDGDGRSDLLWRNEASGETAIWIMNGTTYVAGAIVLANPLWTAVLTGDFNGDGKHDLVWRNAATGEVALWLMDGVTMRSGAIVAAAPDWWPTHAADFTGEGRTDLVWRNRSTGATHLWLMDGLAMLAGGPITLTDSTVVALDDFDDDGRADVVWHDPASATVSLRLMNGLSVRAASALLSSPDWVVVP
jgi:hypothetical protein